MRTAAIRPLPFADVSEPMLDRQAVATWLGVSLRTLDRMRAAESFPASFDIAGPKWNPADIRGWLNKRRGRSP